MRLYKVKYTDRLGRKKTVKKYRVALRIDGCLHRFVAFESKKACDILLTNMQQLKNLRDAGLEPSKKLQLWFGGLSIRLQKKLVELGLLDTKWATSNKTLLSHTEDWEKHLRAKGDTHDYIRLCATRVTQIIEDCGFTYWRDLSASQVENYIANLKNLSKRTRNFYLKSVKQFGTWMVRDGRASDNPLKYLQTSQVLSEDLEHPRRVLALSELNHFLETTKSGSELYGMSGFERWLLYRLAIESGLRANELRSLDKKSFDFKNQTVAVVSGYTKNKRECEQKIMKELCSDLEHYLGNKLPNTPAFPGTFQHSRLTKHTSQMLKLDLEAAGIPYIDDAGRYFDFHALRHQCGSLLAAAGVHPKVAQEILRHSKIDLTMSIYTHVLKGQKEKAITDAFKNVAQPSKTKKEKDA